MFFLKKKKKTKKNKSVLTQQKLSKIPIFYIIFPVITSIAAVYLIKFHRPVRPIKTIVLLDPEHVLSDSEKSAMSNNSKSSPQEIASSIGHFGLYSSIQTYAVKPDELEIAVKKRVFVLKTKLNSQEFLIDNTGNIVKIVDSSIYPLKEVTGLFEHHNKALEFDSLSALILAKDEKKNVATMVELEQTLTKNQFNFKRLGFLLFRGAVVYLDDSVEIVFGHGPFEKKMLKLNELLKQSTAAKKRLSRIELDFVGKAFVKEATW